MKNPPGIAIAGLLILLCLPGLRAEETSLPVPPQDQGLPYTRSARPAAREAIGKNIALYPGSRYAYVAGWLYRAVLGIRNDPAHPGFARFVIHPEPVAEVDWARGHYDSPRGRIAVDWKKNEGAFTLQVEVPANTRATVCLPAGEAKVTEAGRVLAGVPGIVDLGRRGNTRMLEIGSGRYEFACGI